jgi:predicted transcriptional regulator
MKESGIASATAIVAARLEPTVEEALRAIARENDRSLSAEIRRAVRAHIQREGAPTVGPSEHVRAPASTGGQ